VHIQAKAEQEEEFISNTLLKKIQALKKEKESLALNYEQEEEMLTNDLSRKLNQLRQEKVQLEHTLEQEQECLVNKLMRKIEKLETETSSKQTTLDQLRREKVQLENTLEQEQEGQGIRFSVLVEVSICTNFLSSGSRFGLEPNYSLFSSITGILKVLPRRFTENSLFLKHRYMV
jgi:predicted RNase H-like nuclease (RuvC/YqgF family)